MVFLIIKKSSSSAHFVAGCFSSASACFVCLSSFLFLEELALKLLKWKKVFVFRSLDITTENNNTHSTHTHTHKHSDTNIMAHSVQVSFDGDEERGSGNGVLRGNWGNGARPVSWISSWGNSRISVRYFCYFLFLFFCFFCVFFLCFRFHCYPHRSFVAVLFFRFN